MVYGRLRGKAALGTMVALCVSALGLAAGPARADSVAEKLIDILEANGQLAPDQATALREEAVLEREELKREVMDEVRVQAEQTSAGADEFEDVASGEKAVVTTDLAESMKIGGYVQFLASWAPNENGVLRKSAPSGDRDGFDTSDFRETDGFSIRRTRLKLSGDVWERTKYVIQIDADNSDNPGEDDAMNVNDAYLEYAIGDALWAETVLADTQLRAGMFKPATSKERLTSSSKRITIARSMAVNNLGVPDHAIGVMLYNTHLFNDRLELSGGIINGLPDETEDQNDPQTLFARGQVNIFDGRETDYGTADWHVGGSVWGGKEGANGETQTITGDVFLNGEEGSIMFGSGTRVAYSADTGVTVGRFGLDAEAIFVTYDPKHSVPGPMPIATTVLITDEQDFWGYHITPSFWIIPDTLQGVFRYEAIDYDDVNDAEAWATTVGLNWHLVPKYRSVIRANWAHFEHESDLNPATADPGAEDELEQDFFLVEWQVKI